MILKQLWQFLIDEVIPEETKRQGIALGSRFTKILVCQDSEQGVMVCVVPDGNESPEELNLDPINMLDVFPVNELAEMHFQDMDAARRVAMRILDQSIMGDCEPEFYLLMNDEAFLVDLEAANLEAIAYWATGFYMALNLDTKEPEANVRFVLIASWCVFNTLRESIQLRNRIVERVIAKLKEA